MVEPLPRSILVWILLITTGVLQAQDVSQNWRAFSKQLFSPGTIAMPALTSSLSVWLAKPAGFGSNAEAYVYHYGVSLADNVNGKFMRAFALPSVTGRPEVHYVPLGPGHGIVSRLGHALRHSVLANDKFNWSSIPASAFSASLSNAYQPSEQVTWSATWQRTATNQAGYLGGDVAAEFLCNASVFKTVLKAVLGCNSMS